MQNRHNTHENDKKEGYKKQQSTEGGGGGGGGGGEQIHINETTQKLKHSRGVVSSELNSLRIVAHAKDDCRGNILVIFYYIIRLKFNIFRK